MPEEYLIRIALAALVGGLIGLEREYRDKSAGLRTMILIATGSAFFTVLSEIIGVEINDGARISAALVSGVGFLGAGVIIKDGMDIRGLTTAASIWLVASLGMGMGSGEFLLSGVITLGILLILFILPPFERRIDGWHDFVKFTISVKNTDSAEEKILALFAEAGVKVVRVGRSKPSSQERLLYILSKTTRTKRSNIDKVLVNEKAVNYFTAIGADA